MNAKKAIGNYLRGLRVGSGLTGVDMALRCNVTPQFISHVETGKVHAPIDLLARYAVVAGMDAEPFARQIAEFEAEELLASISALLK